CALSWLATSTDDPVLGPVFGYSVSRRNGLGCQSMVFVARVRNRHLSGACSSSRNLSPCRSELTGHCESSAPVWSVGTQRFEIPMGRVVDALGLEPRTG